MDLPNTNWLDKAIEQRNENVTVGLAYSYLQVWDKLDAILKTRSGYYHYDEVIIISLN